MKIAKNQRDIFTIDDWFDYAPPKGKINHWKDNYSAKELAKAWCGTGQVMVPVAFGKMLDSHPEFRNTKLEEGEPEYAVRFDELRGEPRNADLVLTGKRKGEAVAISVEAKANETFGFTVKEVALKGAADISKEKWTKIFIRIEKLSQALLPPAAGSALPLGDLRYQLLTATAGALVYAAEKKAPKALLVIHEVVPSQLPQNTDDLDNFVERLSSGAVSQLNAGSIVGPFKVKGNNHIPALPLYIGKV